MTPDRHALELRSAVVREDFPAAQAAAAEYTRRLLNEIAGLPAAEAAERLRAGCDLLEWSRASFGAARSRMAEDLRRLDCVIRYCTSPAPVRPNLRVDG